MKNPYIPSLGIIEKIKQETRDVKTLRIRFKDEEVQEEFDFVPGQFVEVSVFGVGEAPFSLSSSPKKDFFEISLKVVGNVTNALYNLKVGDTIGVRGPYGNGYPIEKLTNKDLVLVGGGIGLAPLKSMIDYALESENFGRILLLYGARTPQDIVFKSEIKDWEKKGIKIYLTVDEGTPGWRGNVGVITTLFDEKLSTKLKKNIANTIAIICGPPIMIKFVAQTLEKIGFRGEKIFASLERLMKCGIGLCGHCNIKGKYVCLDGPVFSLEEIKGLEGW